MKFIKLLFVVSFFVTSFGFAKEVELFRMELGDLNSGNTYSTGWQDLAKGNLTKIGHLRIQFKAPESCKIQSAALHYETENGQAFEAKSQPNGIFPINQNIRAIKYLFDVRSSGCDWLDLIFLASNAESQPTNPNLGMVAKSVHINTVLFEAQLEKGYEGLAAPSAEFKLLAKRLLTAVEDGASKNLLAIFFKEADASFNRLGQAYYTLHASLQNEAVGRNWRELITSYNKLAAYFQQK